VADNNAAYYYHYDGLGSVVALSNSNDDSCQSYEYSAYGQVAASDPNHPNPYMFTGRRFDIETGLYYYRARYYNPHIGRFMQTDPVGYGAGMNLYAYCGNNPLSYTDPSGLFSINIPTECLEDYSTGYAFADVNVFFADFDFWKHYPQWKLASVELNGDVYDVTIDYIGDACDVCDPDLRITTWGVRSDDGVLNYNVPIVTLGSVCWLTNSALESLIKPEIHNINQWSKSRLTSNYLAALAARWDSLFIYTYGMTWQYVNGKAYSGSDINYIVGGHAMKHYGLMPWTARNLFLLHKGVIRGHVPWDDDLKRPWFWYRIGYNGYDSRKDW